MCCGSSQLTVRQEGEELVRTLRAGDLVIIPKGCWHRNEAPEGVTMLHMTPREGGRHFLGRSRILETKPILWRLATTATTQLSRSQLVPRVTAVGA